MWGRARFWGMVTVGLIALLVIVLSEASSGALAESGEGTAAATLYIDLREDSSGHGPVKLAIAIDCGDDGSFDSLPGNGSDPARELGSDAGRDSKHPRALATIDIPIRPPGPPRELRAVVVEDHVVLTWNPPLDDGGAQVEGYAIHRSSKENGPVVLSEVGDVRTYDDTSVMHAGEYTYRVSAINVAGQGELSKPVTVRVETQLDPGPVSPVWFVLLTITILALAKLLVLTASEQGRFRLALLLAPLIIRGQKVLDHETRHALHDVIIERPGIHYSALREEFGLSNGEAAYHLFMLEREKLVTSVRDGKLKRFYSSDVDLPDGCDRSPDEMRREMVDLVRKRPGINQMEIMTAMAMDRDCASYYLRNLVKEGRLVDGKDGRYTVYVVSRHS